MTLTTRRLVLRPWQDADREPFAAMNADPEVMEFFESTLSREESDAQLDRFAARFAEHGGWGWFAMQERASGEFLGFTGMSRVRFEEHFTPAVEIGWRLARPAWGHGYVTEAAREVVRFAFEDVGLDEVVAFADPRNARSRAVMRRLGMTHDPADDFDHPDIPEGSPLRHMVLYRLCAPRDVPDLAA